MAIRQRFGNSPAIVNAGFQRGAFIIVIPGNELEVWNSAGKTCRVSKSVKPCGTAFLQHNARGIMLECAVRMIQAFVPGAPYLLRGEVGIGCCIEFGPSTIVGIDIILYGICPEISAGRFNVSKCGNSTLVIAED